MSNRYYQGPLTDHFDGTRFFHPGLPASDKGLAEVLKWKLHERATPWPKNVLGDARVQPVERVAGLRIIHIGHASYLIQTGGRNILVDPVWSERASPLGWAGPRRHNPPAIAFDDLPPVDVVLVTHNHYDHLDTATIRRLWRAHRPRIFTPLGNDTILRTAAPEMEVETGDWWDGFSLTADLRVTIVPSYHWSARGMRDRRMALWGGFVLETPAGGVYCAGDTAHRDGAIFQEISRRFGAPEVAMLPIGAYAPRWFMRTQHADPEEAVQIGQELGAKCVLGIHWGTFALTDEPYDEPARRLEAAVREKDLDGARFLALRPGDVFVAASRAAHTLQPIR